MKGGHQDDLLVGIALRTIETCGGLGLAEDVGDAVIADAVAGAKVAVGVVVEGAPANAPSILRIGGQLVVRARVAQGVFAQPLDVIDGLGGKGVARRIRY